MTMVNWMRFRDRRELFSLLLCKRRRREDDVGWKSSRYKELGRVSSVR